MTGKFDHFPPQIEALEAFAGPFDAYRMAGDGCEVLSPHTRPAPPSLRITTTPTTSASSLKGRSR